MISAVTERRCTLPSLVALSEPIWLDIPNTLAMQKWRPKPILQRGNPKPILRLKLDNQSAEKPTNEGDPVLSSRKDTHGHQSGESNFGRQKNSRPRRTEANTKPRYQNETGTLHWAARRRKTTGDSHETSHQSTARKIEQSLPQKPVKRIKTTTVNHGKQRLEEHVNREDTARD